MFSLTETKAKTSVQQNTIQFVFGLGLELELGSGLEMPRVQNV